ncbi:MAG TPA: arsinothricin resistance N-acetyltransferase ArsN1 family A [Candidatus Nanoarchaeia archaeon]|nr:arsinothricin resistance N-acetyltransferase ArsN1 family A [Candidatus Nanoarchaeia archaeon]
MPQRNQLVIRQATAEDAAEIAEIYNQGIDERQATFITTHFNAPDILHKISSGKEKHPFFVATNSDPKTVYGWVSISPYSPRPCYDGIGEVSVYIKNNHRRQGIGEALLKTVFDEAAKLGYWKLMARIFTFNKASIDLFEKQGYLEAGLHKNHGKLDGKWLDVLELEKSIPSNLK